MGEEEVLVSPFAIGETEARTVVAQGEVLNWDEDRTGTSWRSLRVCEVLWTLPQSPQPHWHCCG